MLHDIRLAVRHLAAAPAFAVVAVLTLALGIGVNAAMFSVVDGVLLRPSPVADLDRLVMVWETDRHSGTTREPASVPDFLDFEARATSLAGLAAMAGTEMNAAAGTGPPERLAGLAVSHTFLPMLGITPTVGRQFQPDEDRAGGANVALISEALWTRSFGRAGDVTGRILRLDELPYTIVGVVPDVSDFGVLQVLSSGAYSRAFADRGDRAEVDVWIPLRQDPARTPRDTHPIFLVGRLADRQTPDAAQQELAGIAADLERTYPSNRGRGVFVEPLERVVFGPSRPALLVLMGAVLLVLLVACVNIANLLLTRGATRAREVALRAALGATRMRLARQFLVETLVLAGLGAIAGLALAFVALETLLALAPAEIPRLSAVAVDTRVLGATLAVTLAVSLVFGLVPTWQAMRVDLQDTITGGAGPRTSGGRDQTRLRGVLVVLELALAVVLVVSAGLLIRTVWHLQQVDPGFRPSGVLKAEYQLPRTRYPADFRRWPDFAEMHAFTATVERRAAAIPGVVAAAVAGDHPMAPGFTNSFTIAGRESEAADWPEISVRRVTPSYFDTVGLALVRGRRLAGSDTTSAPAVALINDAAARRFFAASDPVGARINFWGASRTIVGVVANERFHGLSVPAPPAVYLPLAQAPSAGGSGVLLVRTEGDPAALTATVRAIVREIDPELAVFGVEPLDHTLSRASAKERFTMLLLITFAGVALVLAAVGVHGVLGYTVARRTREIGIRVALGAPPARVRRLVMRQGLMLVAIGLALGLGAAVATTRVLASLLFGVTGTDPATYVAVAVVLAAVAGSAIVVPVRRALRIDPATALRVE